MALFKIFKGEESDLVNVPYHEGYAYFCQDTCNLWIDVTSEAGGRLQVNAYAASVLKSEDQEIDIDDLFLKNMVASVAQGGTGRESLTANALLIGNGTEGIKMISLETGDLVIGDAENGIAGKRGIGALFALTEGAPEFGTLPIAAGGTGATDAASARTNLDVYSREEVDVNSTSIAKATTLFAESWSLNGDGTYSNVINWPELKCGKNGDIPPIVTYTSNQTEYNQLNPDGVIATPGSNITFTTPIKPLGDIGIIIIDVR